MAPVRVPVFGLLAAIVAVMVGGAVAQSGDCSSVIISLSPCLDYVTGEDSTPSAPCCLQLAKVVQSDPKCLCQVLNGGGGININKTRALELPAACNVQTPPVSKCNVTAIPPAAISPAGGGPNDVPMTGSSNANAVCLPLSLVLPLLIAVYVWNPHKVF